MERVESDVMLQNPSLFPAYPFLLQAFTITQFPFETRIPAVSNVAVQLLIVLFSTKRLLPATE